MTKIETLTVPTDLGEWLQSRKIGESGAYFSTIDALYHYWEGVISSPTGSFITDNKKELIEVIIGSREYEVEEEPLYHALIKGHELVAYEDAWACNYWNLSVLDGRVFPSDKSSKDGLFSTKMTKSKWNEVGINDSNADFVRVEE